MREQMVKVVTGGKWLNSTCTYQEINNTCYEKTHSTKDSSQNETAGNTQSENSQF